MPDTEISHGASLITGITVHNEQMYVAGQPVESVSIKQALTGFTEFLGKFEKVILVGHNFLSFDGPVLYKAVEKAGLNDQFWEKVVGIMDSLNVFKDVLTDRKSYKLQDLVRDVLQRDYEAHNAVSDTVVLKDLMYRVSSKDAKLKHSITIESFLKKSIHQISKEENLISLRGILQARVVSKHIAEKIAGSGLSLTDLRIAHERQGLSEIFGQPSKGNKPRVTKCQNVVGKIKEYFDAQIMN